MYFSKLRIDCENLVSIPETLLNILSSDINNNLSKSNKGVENLVSNQYFQQFLFVLLWQNPELLACVCGAQCSLIIQLV